MAKVIKPALSINFEVDPHKEPDKDVVIRNKLTGSEFTMKANQVWALYDLLERVLETNPLYRINRLWERVKTKWDILLND